jgi:hypothetical protein
MIKLISHIKNVIVRKKLDNGFLLIIKTIKMRRKRTKKMR